MNKHWHLAQLQEEDRLVAGKLQEERMIRHREMLAEALAERDAAREELAKLKAAQQESVDRTDAGELRAIAHALPPTYAYAKATILRAIGDEPAVEAPKPLVSVPLVSVAEPAAPAQEQEGPFRVELFDHTGGAGCIYEGDDEQALAYHDVDRIVRLLNLGVEAEKLRARVAELEHERQRVCKAVAGGLRDETMMVGSLVWDVVGLKSRADAAEAKLRLHTECPTWETLAAGNLRLVKHAAEAEKRAAEAEAKLAEVRAEADSYAQSLTISEDEVKSLREQLAALGENPIPRALVERHLESHHAGNREAALCRAILAGREPGVAQ